MFDIQHTYYRSDLVAGVHDGLVLLVVGVEGGGAAGRVVHGVRVVQHQRGAGGEPIRPLLARQGQPRSLLNLSTLHVIMYESTPYFRPGRCVGSGCYTATKISFMYSFSGNCAA
jgi:hypothetical protein